MESTSESKPPIQKMENPDSNDSSDNTLLLGNKSGKISSFRFSSKNKKIAPLSLGTQSEGIAPFQGNTLLNCRERVVEFIKKIFPGYDQRKKMHNALLSSTIIAVFLIIAAIVASSFMAYKNRSFKNNCGEKISEGPICDKPNCCKLESCRKAAKRFLQDMNEDIKPCDNFYKFVCDGWMKRNRICRGELNISNFMIMEKNYEAKLKNLINKISLDDKTPDFLKKLKKYYEICLNPGNVAIGYNYLKNATKELGGWPVEVGNEWNENNFNLEDTLIKIHKLGFGGTYLFRTIIRTFKDPSKKVIIEVYKPAFENDSLFRSNNREGAIAEYINNIKTTALQLNVKLSADKDEELQKIFEFEEHLVKIPKIEPNFNTKTILPLSMGILGLDWPKYFNGILSRNVNNEDLIEFYQFAYSYVRDAISRVTISDKRIVANYLLWRLLRENIAFVNGSNNCLTFLLRYMNEAVSSLYVKSYFNETIRNVASQIPFFIKMSISNKLNELSWESEEDKNIAVAKFTKTVANFPFNKELLNYTILNNFFEHLKCCKYDYFLDVINLKEWRADLEYQRLKKTDIKDDWNLHLTGRITSDVHYLTQNFADVGVGVLQDPVYNENLPNYLNFGSSGGIVGIGIYYELISLGKADSSRGSLATQHNNFFEHVRRTIPNQQCLVEQYNKFSFLDTPYKVNGLTTKTANAADNVGFKAAYRGYLLWKQGNYPEKILPGLNYTDRQLFWISLANTFCCKYDRKYGNTVLPSSKESPCMYRVIGPLSNMKEFSEDFNCSSTSKMNPMEKCDIY